MRSDSRAALDKLAISIDEWALVAGLPVGHMQFVEIAREIDKRNVRLLVLTSLPQFLLKQRQKCSSMP